MKQNLNLVLIQIPIDEENISTNFNLVKEKINLVKKNSLVLLPELFLCGYNKNNIITCADKHHLFLSELSEIAANKSISIIGTYSIKTDTGQFYNQAIFINEKGKIINRYNKTHLFRPLNEDKFFIKGEDFSAFDYKNWKIGVNICYDLRFPEAQRSLYHLGTDLIIIPAAWPYLKIDIMKKLAIARAIENQLYVVIINRASFKNKDKTYGGNSMIIAPDGKIITELSTYQTTTTTTINKKNIAEYRNSLNCHKDRRDDIYIHKPIFRNTIK